jgi:hypothetical protein
MDSLLLQDYVTVSSSILGGVATQPAASWLDISSYEDIVLHIDLRSTTVNGSPASSVIFNFQTAPAREEASFINMLNEVNAVGLSSGVGVQVTVGTLRRLPILAAYCPVPPAKYLRWQLFPSDEVTFTTATFRIWVTAYQIGC